MSELEHPEDIGGRLADTLAVRVRQRCSFLCLFLGGLDEIRGFRIPGATRVLHPNAMTCRLVGGDAVLLELEYYSVGGGIE